MAKKKFPKEIPEKCVCGCPFELNQPGGNGHWFFTCKSEGECKAENGDVCGWETNFKLAHNVMDDDPDISFEEFVRRTKILAFQ